MEETLRSALGVFYIGPALILSAAICMGTQICAQGIFPLTRAAQLSLRHFSEYFRQRPDGFDKFYKLAGIFLVMLVPSNPPSADPCTPVRVGQTLR